MFALKKFLAPLFSPLTLSIELMVLGILVLSLTGRKKTGKVFFAFGLLLIILCSYEGFSGRILQTLESQYPPLDLSRIQSSDSSNLTLGEIKWIVILAGGVSGRSEDPYQLQISHHSRVRLIEGIRLLHLLPKTQLILTGGIGFDGSPEATTLSRVAEELGVPRSKMVLEVESRDTKDHPLYVREIVKNDRFILVTSAFHMPRAMKLFAKQGLSPIPAPSGLWQAPKEFWSPVNLFPSASGIRLAELAYHEYLGIAWAWVRGQI